MLDIRLKSFNDFRNNNDYFTNLFTECITEDFAHTYDQYISPEHLEVKNIAYYKNYIDDFKNINDLRYSKKDFNKFNVEVTHITSCLNDLYLNIIEIFVSAYEIDKDKLNLAVSQYFNNIYNIKQNYHSLNLNKTISDKVELNNVFIFVHETLVFLQYHLNKILFIDIDITPLLYSFKKVLKNFKNNIKDLEYEQDLTPQKVVELKDFIKNIPEDKVDAFLNDLKSKMKPNLPKEYHLLTNILYGKEYLCFLFGQKKDLHLLFQNHFGSQIGEYKGFTRKFPKDIYKEIEIPKDNNYQLRKEIKNVEKKLSKILKELS